MLMVLMAAVYARISELFDLYKFSLGATAYCLVRMQATLQGMGDEEAVQLAEAAKAKQEQAQQLQYDWEKKKEAESSRSKGAMRLDDKIDKILSGIVQTAEGLAALEVDSKPNRLAGELLEELFPNGVYHITSKTFDDQHTTVNALLERLNGEYSEHIQTLNLESTVQRLAELNEQFGEKLDPSSREVEYSQVQVAKQEAEEAFHRLISWVMYQYGTDMETFNQIMEPVADQTVRARQHFKRRGTIPEVDPETGEPIENSGEPREEGENSPNDLEGEGQNSGGTSEEETSSETPEEQSGGENNEN